VCLLLLQSQKEAKAVKMTKRDDVFFSLAEVPFSGTEVHTSAPQVRLSIA
jgi:hypothetical protein